MPMSIIDPPPVIFSFKRRCVGSPRRKPASASTTRSRVGMRK
jgi:hypothetical protein